MPLNLRYLFSRHQNDQEKNDVLFISGFSGFKSYVKIWFYNFEIYYNDTKMTKIRTLLYSFSRIKVNLIFQNNHESSFWVLCEISLLGRRYFRYFLILLIENYLKIIQKVKKTYHKFFRGNIFFARAQYFS